MSVCSAPRQAILPFYSLYFASEPRDAAVRFNFSLDTLYIDRGFEDTIAHFMNHLSTVEATKAERIGIAHMFALEGDEDDNWTGDEIWTKLEGWLDKFTGLKEKPMIARDVGSHANFAAYAYVNTLARMNELKDLGLVAQDENKSVELHENYPDELVRRFNFVGDEIPEGSNRVYQWRWIERKMRVVWGWRREYYPGFVAKVRSTHSLHRRI